MTPKPSGTPKPAAAGDFSPIWRLLPPDRQQLVTELVELLASPRRPPLLELELTLTTLKVSALRDYLMRPPR